MSMTREERDTQFDLANRLGEQGYATYSDLFMLFELRLTSNPTVIGYMEPGKARITLNKTLETHQMLLTIRHEILHEYLSHEIRLLEHLAERHNQVYELLDDTQIQNLKKELYSNKIFNFAADYEISNRGYTDQDKKDIKNIKLNGQIVSGLVTEDEHPDWVDLTVEEMYDKLTDLMKEEQEKMKDQMDNKSKDQGNDNSEDDGSESTQDDNSSSSKSNNKSSDSKSNNKSSDNNSTDSEESNNNSSNQDSNDNSEDDSEDDGSDSNQDNNSSNSNSDNSEESNNNSYKSDTDDSGESNSNSEDSNSDSEDNSSQSNSSSSNSDSNEQSNDDSGESNGGSNNSSSQDSNDSSSNDSEDGRSNSDKSNKQSRIIHGTFKDGKFYDLDGNEIVPEV